MRGSGDLIWGGGGLQKPPHLFKVLLVPMTQKNGSQLHNSPRLRCYNIKRTQKVHASCCNGQLFVLVILPSYYSRQGPYETRGILATFALSRLDQMLFDYKSSLQHSIHILRKSHKKLAIFSFSIFRGTTFI